MVCGLKQLTTNKDLLVKPDSCQKQLKRNQDLHAKPDTCHNFKTTTDLLEMMWAPSN